MLEKAKKIKWKEIGILFLIFALGFGIRAHLMQWDLMFEFDTYFHAKMTGYVVRDGFVPDKDPLSYFQEGGGSLGGTNPAFWYFSAAIYKLLFLNSPYDKGLLILIVKLIPALFGALISAAMYLLGKEIFSSRKAGFAAGFLAAVVPAFVYRSMAGFFEEDAVGFLWLVLGLYFLVKAQKKEAITKESLALSAISGIFFGIMAMMWGMFLLVPIVLVAYFIVAAIDLYSKSDNKRLISFAGNYAVSFIVFCAIALAAKGTSWIQSIIDYLLLPIPEGNFLFVGGIAIVMAGLFIYIILASAKSIKESKAFSFASMGLLYLAFFLVIVSFVMIPDLRKGTSIFEWTVGEENTGNQFFGEKFNALIVLPWLALAIIPYYVYKKKDIGHYAIIAFFWILTTLFMAWYKLKFTYTFGLPIAMSGAFLISQAIDIAKQRQQELEKLFVAAMVLFILMAGVGAGSFFVTQKVPNIETDPGWKDALYWIKDNTPKDSNIYNWWDEGHWISFIGERSVYTDNRNMSYPSDQNFALFTLAEDENKAYEMVKAVNANYLVLSYDMVYKGVSFGVYAYNTRDTSDPRMQGLFGTMVGCSRNAESDKVSYQCGSQTYSEEQMNSLPAVWQETPNSVVRVPARQGGYANVRVVIYRDFANSVLYVFSEKTNNTMLAKLWLKKPSTYSRFTEVYSGPVRIYKIY